MVVVIMTVTNIITIIVFFVVTGINDGIMGNRTRGALWGSVERMITRLVS